MSVTGEQMNNLKFRHWFSVILVVLVLVSCATPTKIQPTSTPPETNPFDTAALGNGAVSLGGYQTEFVNPPKDYTLSYDGDPIEVSYKLKGENQDNEVGLMFFLDGVAQPHTILSTSQQDGVTPVGQTVSMSKYRLSADKTVEFTVSINPVTGKVGDSLGLFGVFLFEPSYMPESEKGNFGVYHNANFFLPLTIKMNQDADQQAEDYAVPIETQLIPPALTGFQSDSGNPSGRIQQPSFLLHTGDDYYANYPITAINGQAEMTLTGYGGPEASYRVIVFINNQPAAIDGHESFLLTTQYDKVSTYHFSVDVHDLGRMNSIYAIVNPTGQDYLKEDVYGAKTRSVLLINDLAPASEPTLLETPLSNKTPTTSIQATETPTLEVEVTNAAIPGGDRDLSYLIAENDLTDQNGTYGNGDFFLIHNNQLLFWFGNAGLIDLSSDKTVAIQELPKEHLSEKIELTSDGIAFFWKDSPENCQQTDWACQDAPVMLNVYDSRLNLTDTLNTTEAFGLPSRLQSENDCAISEDGHKVVCINQQLKQFAFFNLQTGSQEPAFDYSAIDPANDMVPNAVKFAGNDRYLAFTGANYENFGFGIIDLLENELVDYTLWDSVSDDILVTNEAIYFHEELKSLTISNTGKLFKYAFADMQKKEIQLDDREESKYIAVSANGKYIATARNSNSGESSRVTIKLYDAQNMTVLREINLNAFVSTLSIDEEDRLLFVQYGTLHLAQYSF